MKQKSLLSLTVLWGRLCVVHPVVQRTYRSTLWLPSCSHIRVSLWGKPSPADRGGSPALGFAERGPSPRPREDPRVRTVKYRVRAQGTWLCSTSGESGLQIEEGCCENSLCSPGCCPWSRIWLSPSDVWWFSNRRGKNAQNQANLLQQLGTLKASSSLFALPEKFLVVQILICKQVLIQNTLVTFSKITVAFQRNQRVSDFLSWEINLVFFLELVLTFSTDFSSC